MVREAAVACGRRGPGRWHACANPAPGLQRQSCVLPRGGRVWKRAIAP